MLQCLYTGFHGSNLSPPFHTISHTTVLILKPPLYHRIHFKNLQQPLYMWNKGPAFPLQHDLEQAPGQYLSLSSHLSKFFLPF